MLIYPLIALLFLTAFYFTIAKPKYVIFFILAIWPFFPSTWGIGIKPGLPLVTLFKGLTFWLWFSFLVYIFKRGNVSVYKGQIKWLILFILMWSWLGLLTRDYKLIQLFKWTNLCLIYYLLFFVGWNIFRDKQDVELFVNILVIQAVVLSVIALFELVGFNPWASIKTAGWINKMMPVGDSYLQRATLYRVRGPFGHPLPLGYHLVLLFPFCLYKRRTNRIIGNISASIIVLAIFYTGTRSVYIAFLCSVLVYVFLSPSRIRAKLRESVLTIVFVVIMVLLFRPLWRDTTAMVNNVLLQSVPGRSYYINVHGRIKNAISSLKSISENYLFGTGMTAINDEGETISLKEGDTPYPILVATESGVMAGVGALLILFVASLHSILFRIRSKNIYGSIFFTAAAASITGYCIGLMLHTSIDSLGYFLIIVAMTERLGYAKDTICATTLSF